ncbi:MAG: peptide deformylase [Odoribacteraceae bacterium]|jgi:peptide deformylase|nr:peptide deformylase [Odoribacteraceae bacterium]
MLLPVYIYGHPVLRQPTVEIDPRGEEFEKLLQNMWETMYEADGIGLAAPQIGKNFRLFVIDASNFAQRDPSCADFKRVFVNPRVTRRSAGQVTMNEGCLSVPGIHEDIARPAAITIAYQDERGNPRVEELDGMRARVVQHEYDHIEGITFIDHLSPLKKRLLKSKLAAITGGNFHKEYRVVLPGK